MAALALALAGGNDGSSRSGDRVTFRFITGGARTLNAAERQVVGWFVALLKRGNDESRFAAISQVLAFEANQRFGDDEAACLEWMLARLDELDLGADRAIEVHLPALKV